MGASSDFVHLHVHSEYSLHDSIATVSGIVRRVADLGQSAVALTDHGGAHGAREFGAEAAARGITPIFGMEAFVLDPERRLAPAHLTLWARNQEGLGNLFQLSAAEPVDRAGLAQPVLAYEQFVRHAGGLILGSGCGAGRIAEHLRAGRTDLAIAEAGRLQDLAGKEHFYVELIADADPALPREAFVEVARAVGAPVLAMNDVHYLEPSEAASHQVFAAGRRSQLRLEDAPEPYTPGTRALLSAAEMHQKFADLPEACANTLRLAEQCEAHLPAITEDDDLRPRIDVGDRSEAGELRELAEAGLKSLYPWDSPPEVRQRLAAELEAIERGNSVTHYLVLHELAAWCRTNGIEVGPGSGTTAGSLVACALGITEIDPIAEGLPFARLAQQGVIRGNSLTVKVPESQRQRAIEYLTGRFGQDRVAAVVGATALGPAGAVSLALAGLGRREWEPLFEELLPPEPFGWAPRLRTVMDDPESGAGAALRALKEGSREAAEVVEHAGAFDGLRATWTSSESVLISREPLQRVLPLVRERFVDTPTAVAARRYGSDFGLFSLWLQPEPTLDVIARWSGECDPDVAEAARRNDDDPDTWRLLGRGDVQGIPMLEADGLADYLRILKPEAMSHLAAALALYRGGAIRNNLHLEYADRKNGLVTVAADTHPELREPYATTMPDTFGILVYQEQWLDLASHVLAISLEEANELRRRFMRRVPTLRADEWGRFLDACDQRGLSAEAAEMLWVDLQTWGDLAMLRAHIVGEARMAYRAAYLKAHHPEYTWAIDGTAW